MLFVVLDPCLTWLATGHPAARKAGSVTKHAEVLSAYPHVRNGEVINAPAILRIIPCSGGAQHGVRVVHFVLVLAQRAMTELITKISDWLIQLRRSASHGVVGMVCSQT